MDQLFSEAGLTVDPDVRAKLTAELKINALVERCAWCRRRQRPPFLIHGVPFVGRSFLGLLTASASKNSATGPAGPQTSRPGSFFCFVFVLPSRPHPAL
jgi:hypothetical protein